MTICSLSIHAEGNLILGALAEGPIPDPLYTSSSTFHSHSSKRRRSKSRSLSPHKQRVKSHSTRRRSRSQSPFKKRLSSRSRRHRSSSRHRSRSLSPKSHRRDRYCMHFSFLSTYVHIVHNGVVDSTFLQPSCQ